MSRRSMNRPPRANPPPSYKSELNPATESVTEYVIRRMLDELLEKNPTVLSREITLELQEKFNCKDISNLVIDVNRYLDEIEKVLSQNKGFQIVQKFRLKTFTRLSIGVRNPYLPLEIGLQWDPIFNLPYIPSSAIKGLVRSYLEDRNIHSVCNRSIEEMFGSERKGQGLLVLFDAYPVSCERSLITAEIINPHYTKANSEIDVRPIPLIYPVVTENTEFEFLIAFSREERLNIQCFQEIQKYVTEALNIGIGAKTSLGYGVFKNEL